MPVQTGHLKYGHSYKNSHSATHSVFSQTKILKRYIKEEKKNTI